MLWVFPYQSSPKIRPYLPLPSLNVLRTREDIWSNEDYDIVGSQDEIKRDLNVELLSVKFSKVGQKTFDNYPNLKWRF